MDKWLVVLKKILLICTYASLVSYLPGGLQGPKRHLVVSRCQRPEGSRQLVHSVSQSTVYVDRHTTWSSLQTAGMDHHMMLLAVRQRGVAKTGGASPTISLLVTDRH